MYYWIEAQHTFVIRQSAITGGVVEGEFHQDGSHATQTETVFNPDGSRSNIKIAYELSADQFHMSAQFQASGNSNWIPALEMSYRKVSVE